MSEHIDIEDALEFLAGYHKKNVGAPTPRLTPYDQPVVNNLASKSLCKKPFSVKQGNLALVFVRKYRNQLRRGGVDIDNILARKSFRLKPLQAMVSILCFEHEPNEGLKITLSFAYDQRLIKMLHDRNNEYRSNNSHRIEFDSKDKKWSSDIFIDNFEFMYKLAKNNQFYIEPLIEEYMAKITEYRKTIKKPSVNIQNGKLTFTHLFDAQKKHLEQQFDV